MRLLSQLSRLSLHTCRLTPTSSCPHRLPSLHPLSRSPFSSAPSAPVTAVTLQLQHRLGPHLNDRTPGDVSNNPLHALLRQQGLPSLVFPPLQPSPTPYPASVLTPALFALQHDRIAPLLTPYEHLYPLPRPPSPPRRPPLRMEDPGSPSVRAPSPTPAFPPSPVEPLSLMELVQLIQSTLSSPDPDLSLIHSSLSSYDASLGEWRRFAFWDPSKRYTRNLIATDYAHYTLMLLCWNPKLGSPVHNHAASECFMRVVEGQVVESQYHCLDQGKMTSIDAALPSPSSTSSYAASSAASSPSSSASSSSSSCPLSASCPLRLRRRLVAKSGSVLFINDSIGLHKIDNPFDEPAVTLHCYIPPYDSCQCYEEDTGATHESYVSFHSEHGEKVDMH